MLRLALRRVTILAAVLVQAVPTTAATRTTAHNRIVWTGGFETGDFRGWDDVLREGPGAATIVRKPVRQGRFAAKFVLEPQMSANGSRIEAHQPDPIFAGGEYGSETLYAWDEYIPASTRFARHASFNHLVQWHPYEECYGSSLAVDGEATPPRLLLRIRGGRILRYGDGCEMRYDRTFRLGRLKRDRWLRFRMHVRWSDDPNLGFVELWKNGVRVVRRTPVATTPPGIGVYLRQGLYRFRCTCRTVVFGDGMTVRSSR